MWLNLVVVAPFIILSCLSLTQKNSKKRFEMILLTMALNPVGLSLGIFENEILSNFANLVYYLMIPIAINRTYYSGSSIKHFNKKIKVFFALLVFSNMTLTPFFDPKLAVKTLILFMGTWLWAILISNFARDPDLDFHSRSIHWIAVRAGLVVIFLGQFFRDSYFLDNRLILSGGYLAASTLALFLFYLTFKGNDLGVLSVLLGVVLASSLLILSGSVAGTFATLIFFGLTPFLGVSKDLARGTVAVKTFIAFYVFPILLFLFLVSGRLNATRNYNILSLFSSESSQTLGTVEWRKYMWSYMWEYFQNSPLLIQVIGNGLGSGTGIARQSYANIPPDYTSGRVFHNAFIQLLIENGLISAVFFFFLLLGVLRLIPSRNRPNFMIWYFAYFLTILSGNAFALGGTFSVIPLGMILAQVIQVSPYNLRPKFS